MKRLLGLICFAALLVTMILPTVVLADSQPARGDANADDAINMKDVLVLRKYIAGISVPGINTLAADVNGDDAVNMKDVLLLRQYIANYAVTFAPYATTAAEPTVTEEPTTTATEAETTVTEVETTATEAEITTTESQTTTTEEKTTASTTASTKRRTTHKPYEDFSPYYIETDRPDRVTLSFYDTDSETLGITWHTTLETPHPVLQYVPAASAEDANFDEAVSVEPVTEILDAKGMPYDPLTNLVLKTPKQGFMSVEDFTHRAVLDALEYDTTYAYRVGDAETGVWSDTYTFKTRPETIGDFSFVYMSDTQVSNPWEVGSEHYMHDALLGAAAIDPNFSFIVHGGDIVEISSYLQLWQVELNGNKDFLTRYPMMSVSGNHEGQNDGYGPYSIYRHQTNVFPAQDDTLDTGVYYSFNYGNTHFAVLNTCSDGQRSPNLDSAQQDWLEEDLKAATDAKWKIVVMHVPMVGKHETLGSVHRLFLETGVDMVLEADEHLYLRSYPIGERSTTLKDSETRTIDGVEYTVNPQGVIYSMYATGGDAQQNGSTLPSLDYLACYSSRGNQSSWANIFVTEDSITVRSFYYNGGLNTPYPGNSQWGIIKE